jgi:hypothetical protein
MQKLIYYDTDGTGGPIKIMSSSSLFSAVEDASSGKSRYKHSENFVERLARVRFIIASHSRLELTSTPCLFTATQQQADSIARHPHFESYKICVFRSGIYGSVPLSCPSADWWLEWRRRAMGGQE